MNTMRPVIKGIFVNSHIKFVRQQKGEEGIHTLEQHYGKPLKFKNSDNVPVCEEVKILEAALDVLSDKRIPGHERAFEAGRLHFRNFTTTPLAKIIFSLFRKNFKLMMIQTHNIAGHVFQGVRFSTEELGSSALKVIMENNDYPLDHFRGLFQEWMDFSGYSGVVEAKETAPNRFEYTMRWKESPSQKK